MSLTLAACVVAAPGLHRLLLTAAYLRIRNQRRGVTACMPACPPRVTVQLPVYNERFVVSRLIRAAADLRYPRDRLEIQVLDDSTDETSDLITADVSRLRDEGLRIEHVRRTGRSGFKAGALASGMDLAQGELFAVFDADFMPPPDFLERVVGAFDDPGVGFVQVRWHHANREASWLTRTQAALLDGHFLVEHRARAAAGLFFNFNGTAGVLRRRAIEAAGGWQSDTLTEDLDLSYRMQLAGWRGVYLHERACPGELPATIPDFKRQQHRWVAGAIQTARKLIPRLVRAPLPVTARLEATAHLLTNLAYPALLLLFVVVWQTSDPAHVGTTPVSSALLGSAMAGILMFYAMAIRDGAPGRVLHLPASVVSALALGSGLALSNTLAVVTGFISAADHFERTPKVPRGTPPPPGYRSPVGWLPVAELVLAAALLAKVADAASRGMVVTAALVAIAAAGTLIVAVASMREALGRLVRPVPLVRGEARA